MRIPLFFLAAGALLLSGCAGVKSSFDCGASTSDTCMTMTKANQLARDKAPASPGKLAAGGLPSLVNLPDVSASRQRPAHPVGAAEHAFVISPPVSAPAPVMAGTPGKPVVTHPLFSGASAALPAVVAARPAALPSCGVARCDSPGQVLPQRAMDQMATVWIAPWVDSDNTLHQPGRVSFVARPADWVIPPHISE